MRIDSKMNYSEVFPGIEPDKKMDTVQFKEILEAAQKEQDDVKLKQVCQELESVFVHQMLSQMRKTIPKDGYLQSSHAENIFQDMLDMEYAQKISQNEGLGLAQMLYRQLNRNISKE